MAAAAAGGADAGDEGDKQARGAKRRAEGPVSVDIECDGGDAFDEGFTVEALSMGAAEFAAAVPPERRVVAAVASTGRRVAFDVVEVYRWLRTNPTGGLCGPFGQCPLDEEQRRAIIERAERILPKRQRLRQEERFDYAWHDDGSDLHYHPPASAAYLAERVAEADHEGVAYCLEALGPGAVASADDALSLLVRAANLGQASMFGRLATSEHVGGLLSLGRLAGLMDQAVRRPLPRVDLVVPLSKAMARAAESSDALAGVVRSFYRYACAACCEAGHGMEADDDSDEDDSDDDDDDDSDKDGSGNSGARRRSAAPGALSAQLHSAVVRAIAAEMRIEPDRACLIVAVETRSHDLLDHMLDVAAGLSADDAGAVVLRASEIGCEASLRLVLRRHAATIGAASLANLETCAARLAPPSAADAVASVFAVWRRSLGRRGAGDDARPRPTQPRRMVFAS
jgi:hypothetical protein